MSDQHKQPLFSPEELDENLRTKTALIEACTSEESVLIVGAGLGRRLGYPTWSELLEKLHELVVSLAEEHNQPFTKPTDWKVKPLRYADCLRSHVQVCTNSLDRYHDFLWRTFDSREGDLLHRQLIELPFRGIVTTNYDPSLDHALNAREIGRAIDSHFVVDQEHAPYVSEFIACLRLRNSDRRQIAHLHGRFNSPAGIILTESDYRKRYDPRFDPSQKQQLIELIESQGLNAVIEHVETHLPEWTLHRKFLWTLLSSRTAVFLGFSMEDPYFTQMLKTVVNDLWRWNRPSHFAVMALSPDDELAKEKARHLRSVHGVAVVFYENRNGQNHAELDSLIQEICSACGVGGPQNFGPTDHARKRPQDKGGVSEWMTKVNERTRRRAGHQ